MGIKKKREMQVAALTVRHQDLETLRSFADVEGKNLASLLLHCVQLEDGVSQIHYVKQIVPLLEKADTSGVCDPAIQSCLDILAAIYYSLSLKNPLKKVLASSLNGLPEFFHTEAIHSFTSHLEEELNTTDLYSYRKVVDNISSCMENFNLGKASVNNLLKNVLHFLQKSLIEILEENRKFAGNHIVQTQLMNDLLVGIRVSMMLVQKVQDFQENLWKTSTSPIWQSMCGLLGIFTKFLSDATFCHLPEGIKFETDPLSGLASGLQELQKTEEYHVELYRESTLGCSVGPVARVQQRLQWKETKGATYRLLTSKRYLKN